jgi:hypothetical protein
VTAPEDRVNLAIEMLFPKAFLDAVDPDDTHGRTGRETRIEEYMRRFNLTSAYSFHTFHALFPLNRRIDLIADPES